MIVLGIETSCDDTSAAVCRDGEITSNVISTQIVHRKFGGVVPELASRSHIKMILPVIRNALEQSGVSRKDIEGIGVTFGPGLSGSLLVGLSSAKALALSLDVPLIGINHLEGHLWANKLTQKDLVPPFLTLIVSGGHTQLVLTRDWGDYQIIGRTRDDAAGEAFDKVARLLKLGYPGGPFIEKEAQSGESTYVSFPRGLHKEETFDFSFSGLKTAVLNHTELIGPQETEKKRAHICASFQEAVVDVLSRKVVQAARQLDVTRICLAGGVAMNKALRERVNILAKTAGFRFYWPGPSLCTDNGGMIAGVAHHYLAEGHTSPLTLAPNPSLNF